MGAVYRPRRESCITPKGRGEFRHYERPVGRARVDDVEVVGSGDAEEFAGGVARSSWVMDREVAGVGACGKTVAEFDGDGLIASAMDQELGDRKGEHFDGRAGSITAGRLGGRGVEELTGRTVAKIEFKGAPKIGDAGEANDTAQRYA